LNLETTGVVSSASISLHPKNSKTTTLTNKIKPNLRMGYETTADLTL
jgi:hypothetical protein